MVVLRACETMVCVDIDIINDLTAEKNRVINCDSGEDP